MRRLFSSWAVGACLCVTALAVVRPAGEFFYLSSPQGVYFRIASAAVPSPTPQSLTNAQKLSLPANTPVGTRVQVTDGFVVLSFFDENGFYAPFDVVNGKTRWKWVEGPDEYGTDWFFTYDGAQWTYAAGEDTQDWFDPGNEDNPWSAYRNEHLQGDGYLTHPAVQQLTVADPSDESHWEVVPP